MAKVDDQMQRIGQAIVSQAEQESKEIIEKANAIREAELASYKEQLIDGMFETIQQQTRTIRQKAITDKALVERKAYRELLTRRDELTASVFLAAKTKLFEYLSTPAYWEGLEKDLTALQDNWNHAESIVLLREADLVHQEEIMKILPGCKVQASPAIKIGGFILRNQEAGVLVDETLDARLKAQRPWFLQTCGMKVIG